MYVQYVCMYVHYVCTSTMYLHYVCTFTMYVRPLCMYIHYVSTSTMYVRPLCTSTMYVRPLCTYTRHISTKELFLNRFHLKKRLCLSTFHLLWLPFRMWVDAAAAAVAAPTRDINQYLFGSTNNHYILSHNLRTNLGNRNRLPNEWPFHAEKNLRSWQIKQINSELCISNLLTIFQIWTVKKAIGASMPSL